jgi:Ca-activated chloride channel family protein
MDNKRLVVALCAALAVTGACDSAPTDSNPAEPIEQPEELAEVEEEVVERFTQVEADEAAAVPTDSANGPTPDEPADLAKNEVLEKKLAVGGEGTEANDLALERGGKTSGSSSGEVHALGNLSSIGSRGGSGKGIGGLGLGGVGRGGGGSAYGVGVGARGSASVPRIRAGSVQVRGRAAHQFATGTGASPVPSRDPASNTEEYTNHGVNRFVDASEDAKSTFAIDVDTGSYTIARRKLQNGMRPPKAAVRVEEFVNYFGYDYRPPTNGDSFAVYLEAAPTPLAGVSDRYLLRVGVQGKKIRDEDRKPVHLTFLVDVSGSMRQADKIGLVKRSLRFLTQNLEPTDTVAIATYAGNTRKVLDRTSAADSARIIDALDQLHAGGSTAMSDGLSLAYGLAMKGFQPDHENRVIVLSDGDANVGSRNHSDILEEISKYVKKGVTLSTVGFGMGNYRDTLMEQLANKGNGNYSYIDSMREAEKVFGQQLDGTLQVIAKDVKIQVEFNPAAVARYRLVGYENRDIADKDFRNDKVDAGEIGAGHTVTAIYEIDLAAPMGDLPDDFATVRVRNKTPRGTKAVERAFSLKKGDVKTKLSQASKDYQFAAAVVAFAEKLRESPYARDISYDLIEEIAAASTRGKSERKELVELVRKARAI